MSELAREIAERRCPKCNEQGTLELQLAHATVVCLSCLASYIDPFEEGPWDDEDIILDKLGDKVVSYYQIEEAEEIPDNTLNEAWAEFHKYLIEREKIQGG